MTAGKNCRIDVWRISFNPDDSVGGAQPTGTVIGNYEARFQSIPASQLLLQQGLETVRTFTAVVVPGTVDIQERDEIQITHPYDHMYYGDMFRIISITYSSHNPRDPRNYLMLTLTRSVEAHAYQ